MKRLSTLKVAVCLLIVMGCISFVQAYNVSYSYDDAGRLTRVVYVDKTIAYTYDAAGNLLNREVTEVTPGSLQFSSAAFSVSESGGNGSVTVTRTGGSVGVVSVTVATSNGTALAGVDYTAVNTVVNWADSDSADKIVQVPISDDWAPEVDKTVNLALQSPVSATLGSPETAVLTIEDDDVHSDADNVPDAVENGAPNGGDGNDDGEQDAGQAHVVSLQNAQDGNYACIVSSDDTTVVTVQTTGDPSGGNTPPGVVFACGFFTITVSNVAPGSCIQVTLILYNAAGLTTYYKYDPTEPDPNDRWYEFTHDGTTGATISQETGYTRVVLDLCDGGRGDHDTVGGTIFDPGGPVFMDSGPQIPTLTEWGIVLLILIMAGLSGRFLAGLKKRKAARSD